MTKVEKLAQEVGKLSAKELSSFRKWFAEFDAAAWDRQIEEDSKAGRLDSLVAEARADYETGRTRKL